MDRQVPPIASFHREIITYSQNLSHLNLDNYLFMCVDFYVFQSGLPGLNSTVVEFLLYSILMVLDI